MSYNWQEIFKSKTSKELYKIYIGDTQLPSVTKEFAKKELERRKFNFDDVDAHKTGWKLSNLIEEDNYLNSEMSGQGRVFFVNFKIYILFLLAFFVLIYFTTDFKYHDTTVQLRIALIMTIIYTVLVFINNFFFKRIQIKREQRKKRIIEIREILKEQKHLDKDSPILSDLIEDRKIELSGYKTMSKTYVIVTAIIFAIAILYNLLK